MAQGLISIYFLSNLESPPTSNVGAFLRAKQRLILIQPGAQEITCKLLLLHQQHNMINV